MTQFAQPSLNAAVDDGITLSTKFNGAIGALYSSHSGSAAPPSPVKGQTWVDTSLEGAATPVLMVKAFTGSVWRTLGTLDLTTGAYTTAGGLPLTGGTVTGPILFPSGTVGAPSISFAGDTDNGIYRVAADQIGFTTAGVQRILLTGTTFDVLTGLARIAGTSSILHLDRATGAAGSSTLNFRSGSSARWAWNMTGAESTGNAGANLFLQAFDDAGTLLVNFLQFQRGTRQLGINGAVANTTTLISLRSSDNTVTGLDFLDLMNTNTGADAYSAINFRTASGAFRASVRGERPGASNNGDLGVWTGLSGVPNRAATFRANGNLDVVGAITSAGAAVTSTRAVKSAINDAPSQLDIVKRLRVVTFTRNPPATVESRIADDESTPAPSPPREELGFIAEEVVEIMPEAVTPDNAIHLMDMIASLTKAVQELSAKVAALEGKS